MVLDFIANIILLIGIISVFNLTRYVFKIRKIIKMHKDNPNIQGITVVNGEVKIIEKKPEQTVVEVIPQVVDEICGKSVNPKEAYRILAGDKEHYFCSWECREAFMKRKKEEGK